MKKALLHVIRLLGCLAAASQMQAGLKLPGILADHMVLQQGRANPIWGWDEPGTTVAVQFAGQRLTTVTAADGCWQVSLAAMPASAMPRTLTVTGTSERKLEDVVIGEVWLCAGQSNMAMKLAEVANGVSAAAALPDLRLHVVPQAGPPENPDELYGAWSRATPATALVFSAVGFLFGRELHDTLGVPVGLIDVTWGGSTTEAWIPHEALAGDDRFRILMATAVEKDAAAASAEGRAAYAQAVADWKIASAQAAAANRPLPGGPPNWLAGGTRPGNLFGRMIAPLAGFGMRGVIWYQGESNTWRAHEHGDLFPLLIGRWRQAWGQGDFPFYWVQLPGFGPEPTAPTESRWAELRETQTKTLRLPNTGQAVAVDQGDAQDLHPRNKHEVAARLARWALVRDYGREGVYRSPEFKRMEITGTKATVELDCFGSTLEDQGAHAVRGFALCGGDRVWRWATARIIDDNRVEVESAEVPEPVAVRYAWADYPSANLSSKAGLPVTPFRTDDFPMITATPVR